MTNSKAALPFPTNISKKSNIAMLIEWSDGTAFDVPFTELRYQCRCAECVDEWTRRRRITRDKVKEDVHPLKVESVGRYAIQISWSDGHGAGIYPFELLHQIATGSASEPDAR